MYAREYYVSFYSLKCMTVLSKRMRVTSFDNKFLDIPFLITYVASLKILISHYYFLQGHFLVREHLLPGAWVGSCCSGVGVKIMG